MLHLSFLARSLGPKLEALLGWRVVVVQVRAAHAVGELGGVVVSKEQSRFAGTAGIVLVAQAQGGK